MPASLKHHGTVFWQLLIAILVFLPAVVQSADPLVTNHTFEHQPSTLVWFDDSEVLLAPDPEAGTIWRSPDAGASWKKCDLGDKHEASIVKLNPNNKDVAIALGFGTISYYTKDQGDTWTAFDHEFPITNLAPTISWHADDPAKVIINVAQGNRDPSKVKFRAVYTTNGFRKSETLRDDARQCLWAKEKAIFGSQHGDIDKNRVLCIALGTASSRKQYNRIVTSDDYFDTESEPDLVQGQRLSGVVSMVTASRFVLAARETEDMELEMYTTNNTIEWHRALFGNEPLTAEAFTVQESTNYSVQVDVKVPGAVSSFIAPMGMLFTSNSLGTNFVRTEDYTNRDEFGIVDFEKVANLEGVFLTNIVTNGEDVLNRGSPKRIQSRITFDDGRSFHKLTGYSDGKDPKPQELQLHSVTQMNNIGRVYSTASPGILIGVGSLGPTLREWSACNTYVSDDGGLTWRHSLIGPHRYEVGDSGALIVAAWDHDDLRRVIYSTKHGDIWSWQNLHFVHESQKHGVVPMILTTTPDSTSKKFVLLGYHPDTEKNMIFHFDFTPLDLPQCKSSDFEQWTARSNKESDDATCIMGHTQTFERRKPNADCFVNRKYEEATPKTENCVCTEYDFECDVGFVRSQDRKSCLPVGDAGRPGKNDCKDPQGTYKSPSGFRKIPGNTCEGRGSKKLDEEIVERPCDGSKASPPAGDDRDNDGDKSIKFHVKDDFEGQYFLERVYLEYSPDDLKDETVIALLDDRQAWVSHDQGQRWTQPADLEGASIAAVYLNRYARDDIYFITTGDHGYYSRNRGKSIHRFKQPSMPSPEYPALRFHEKNRQWLLWTGCATSSAPRTCESAIFRSVNGGEDWIQMKKGVENCEFIYREARDGDDEKLEKTIFCVDHLDEDMAGKRTLTSSNDWFERKPDEVMDNILNFATHSEFVVVAKRDEEEQGLRLECSADAERFATAHFPKDLEGGSRQGYTVLDSSTHSIFLHATVNAREDQEYGTLVKSNSNGTSFVSVLPGVNRNVKGYADFEKMLGFEGAAMANVVANTEEVDTGSAKKLKTMFSHNDGADWLYLNAPAKDVNGDSYGCDVKNHEKCSLHLKGYTTRADPRATYSSPSATGLILGVGTVGEHLGPERDHDTFLSNDGGVTWRNVQKGAYLWEFGDQGSILVLVKQHEETDYIYWSIDEGENWKMQHFPNDRKYQISHITTIPSDGSLRFMLWGTQGGRQQPVTISIDFSNIMQRQCELPEKPEDMPDNKDYTWWTPKHPSQQDDCLFGHVYQYVRRKVDSKCFNGKTMADMQRLQGIKQNCSCNALDFECDFNYVRTNDNRCVLSTGLEAPDPQADCSSGAISYRETTGYRKIPVDTCVAGKESSFLGPEHPCPGKEADFGKAHQSRRGLQGAALLFVILIPLSVAAAIGVWVYRNYESKFGRIRLGDGGSVLPTGGLRTPSLDTNSPWVRYPVAALSGVAAVILAVPALVGGAFKWVAGRMPSRRRGWQSSQRYNSRDAFARSRGRYQIVGDTDEADLLGEESDEES